MVEAVAEYVEFPKEEEKVLEFWKRIDAFQTCLKQSKGKPRYSFYDGPPFATGLPHYGHILAGTLKDIVTRYAHQNGYHIERRFGWDTHGLPVEYEIDKALGIKGPDDVARMGVANYNNECRKIVMRYADEWERIFTRLGRWIDFKNDYKTLYPSYMETEWWVFKELFNKGLVYKGAKVMPYSTTCSTPLSNFESGQNYKDVVDPAVIVSFPLDESPDVSLIAWTTTPWTLPSNLSVCLNPEKDYVKIKDNSNGKIYIMMEARIEILFKQPEDYTIIEKFKGETLKNKTYQPLFPYFAHLKEQGAFRVLCDGYVTEEGGTGVVHQAPYFGEDDNRVCLAAGIITKDMDMVCPIDASGLFVDPVTDFKGQYVKDADKNIMKHLKSIDRLVNQSTVKHSYPFCWRSDTPLIYRAIPSWFIRVECFVDKLLENNQKTYWVPDFVKEKRFANWLADARDWAVSRNRYFGTPIPLWVSDDMEEVVCIGSIEELKKLSGQDVTDLHRESVDQLTIPSRCGKGVLRRVSEVFDCWFESGSMPYGQAHYPFENKKEFEESFPADFVAEGIDQTRGWFYTLMVLSTALFGKPTFKNLVCHGLVLASDGQKMSKRKKNYPDPMDLVNKYGSDAIRLYLINSPVVRGDNLRFKEEGVRDILKDVFLPWYNAYRFLVQNIQRFEKEEGKKFRYCEKACKPSDNIMDKWILSFTQSLLLFVRQEMKAYRLYTVVPRLVKFVDHLTNWYVRFNRKRLKGDGGVDDCLKSLETLTSVLLNMVLMMAPFTPFLSEQMYQNLRHVLTTSTTDESVHYLMIPQPRLDLIDETIERAVSRMQAVIELGRTIRDRKTLPIKYPLPEVVVIHKDQECLDDIKRLETYILEELNVKTVMTSSDKEKYGVLMRAEPDHKILGARLKGAFKAVTQAIKELTDEQIQSYLTTGTITLCNERLEAEELRIMYTFSGEGAQELAQKYEADASNDVIVLVDVTPDQAMLDEGVAREVINRIQKLRKKAHLVPLDPVTVFYSVSPPTDPLARIIHEHAQFIESTIKSPVRPKTVPKIEPFIIDDKQPLKGASLEVIITRGFAPDWSAVVPPDSKKPRLDTGDGRELTTGEDQSPFCKYVNVSLQGTNRHGMILLENPQGRFEIDINRLRREVEVVFDMRGQPLRLYLSGSTEELDPSSEVNDLNGRTIIVCNDRTGPPSAVSGRAPNKPVCAYVNVEVCAGLFNGKRATLLLENPSGEFIPHQDILKQMEEVFRSNGQPCRLFISKEKTQDVKVDNQLRQRSRQTLYLY